jgi:histone-lysine N-methyltransferase SETMAR
MMSQQWFFHWDNAPLLIAAIVSSWCNTRGVQWLEHPPYSPNLAPADCFLLKKPKWGLAGRNLDQDGIKNAWEGVTRSLIAVAFAAAFRSWLEHCKKCVRLGGEFTEKS